jgi:hypothetical protein
MFISSYEVVATLLHLVLACKTSFLWHYFTNFKVLWISQSYNNVNPWFSIFNSCNNPLIHLFYSAKMIPNHYFDVLKGQITSYWRLWFGFEFFFEDYTKVHSWVGYHSKNHDNLLSCVLSLEAKWMFWNVKQWKGICMFKLSTNK